MAKINGNEIRPGNVLEHNDGLWIAVKVNHVKPGKGGAFAQVEMKNLRNVFAATLFIVGSICAQAQSKVAHINTQELVESMPEMMNAKSELEKLAKTYETDIQAMATELQNKIKQYDAESSTKTDEENGKRLQEVQSMEQSIRQYQGQAQQDLQKKEIELLKPITEKAKAAILKVGNDQGFNYVLDSSQGQGVIMANGKDLLADVKAELGF